MILNPFLKHLLGLSLVRRIGAINIKYLFFRGRKLTGYIESKEQGLVNDKSSYWAYLF